MAGRGATGVEAEKQGIWSADVDYACEPSVPASRVKHWREPVGYEHVESAPHLVPFKAGDKVVFGFPVAIGVVVRAAHYLLAS